MSSYLEGLKGAVGGAVCFVADKLDSAATYTFGTPPGSIRGSACNNPTPPPPTPPPFTGGQCSGVSYIVTYSYDVEQGNPCGTQTFGPFTRTKIGPIRGLRTATTGVDCSCPGGSIGAVYLQSSNSSGGLVEEVVGSRAQDCISGARIISVSRVGGSPDDCGDPPPPPPVPPPSQPINFTYVNNQGDNVNVSGDVNIGIPILIAPFTLVAPVTITAGGISFNGSVNLSPEFDVTISPSFGGSGNGPGGGGGGTGQPTQPIPPDDEDPNDDSPAAPVACEDLPLKGLVVTLQFSEEMNATELIQNGGIPSLGVPRVAIAYFVARVGNREVYMPGIDLKSRQQYVPVPFNSLVTCWRIHLEPGVSISSVRPIFDIPHS